jgi:hypothetical protein
LASPGSDFARGDDVPVPVAGGRQRVDRVDEVPGFDERADEQPSIDLDPHDHLGRILDVLGDHRVQLSHPGHVVAHLAPGQHGPLAVQDAHVVTGLRPVDPHEDHEPPPLIRLPELEGHAAR